MFLSNINAFKLDEIMKSFEVAYRSHASKVIIDQIETDEDFLLALKSIDINQSSLINSGKYNGKLNKMKKSYKEIYRSMEYSHESMAQGDIADQDNENSSVLYVSELIDIILLLANPYFNNLFMNFDTQDKFIYFSEIYKEVRNTLSHPASAKISLEDTKIIILYVQRLISIIDDECFWYKSKDDIKRNIEELTESISDIPELINNLNEIAIQYKKVIGRDKELDTLLRWIIGEEGSYRTANSVVAYGYGGIGKTTLIVEFIYEILKRITDKEIRNKYNYILFFSSKEEKLNYKQTSDKLYIDKIRQQITSFNDFKESLCNYLNLDSEDDIYRYMDENPGIIVIDNIENLINKDELITFIKRSPRTVQYIVTSRNEEMCEEKLNIVGFDENNNGLNFIDNYIEINELNLDLSTEDKKKLIDVSSGNTLILVTSLERIKSNASTIQSIIGELINISSYNTQQIADFMYKNTFDQTLETLKKYNVENLLSVIALYEEPIDLYAMSELTGISIKDIEYMCETLTGKLVLYKAQDLFTLNDFASKFIFSKILNDRVELSKLSKKIEDYKIEINSTLYQLDKIKKSDKFLMDVMNDWMPRNNTDQITIANAFTFYNRMCTQINKFKTNKKNGKNKDNSKNIEKQLQYIEDEFKKYELKSPHPYIRYQKARVYKLFIDANICNKQTRKTILNRMKINFEEAKFSVEFYYQYIKGTLSYAAFLWIYGTFLRIHTKDNTYALSILNQSKYIYEKLDEIDVNYIKLCNEIAKCYKTKYHETNDVLYYDQCREICKKVLSLEEKTIRCEKGKKFDFDRFRNQFKGEIL